MANNERIVPIRGDLITLGQLVKLVDLIGSGGEIKDFLARTKVLVNGELDSRRGRKLHPGDIISFPGGPTVRLVSKS